MFDSLRKKLQQQGKKAHVIDGLVQQVEHFADYLLQKGKDGLASATQEDLAEYLQACETQKTGGSRIQARGLALYFAHSGQAELAEFTTGLRAQAVAQKRPAFKLKDFRGLDERSVSRLAEIGITNVKQMLDAGKTPTERQELAQRSGLDQMIILELVKLSDLARIDGLKGIRARLYYEAGVETPETIAGWEPEALRLHLQQWVDSSGFDGIPPLPKEVLHTVQSARKLEQAVEY